MSSVPLSPEALNAYGTTAVLAAFQTLLARLGGGREFLDFLASADPLWQALLLDKPHLGPPSASTHPLAIRYTVEETMNSKEFTGDLAARFGQPYPQVSLYVLSVLYGPGHTTSGFVVVVGSVDKRGESVQVLQTVSSVLSQKDAEGISMAMWRGELPIPTSPGQVYTSTDIPGALSGGER